MNNIFYVLFVVFLVLKICAVIAWPWLYVFAPLIANFALAIGGICCAAR